MAGQEVERFTVWGGRIIGGIGLAVIAVVLVFGVVGSTAPYHPAAYPICGLVALAIWVMLIRPAVSVAEGRLLLRNPVSTVSIPLASIEHLVVRQWLAVRAGTQRFNNAGIGRSYRQGLRDDRRGAVTGAEIATLSYGAVVEHRLQKLAEEARLREGVELYSDEQVALADDVRREWAWPEIGLLAVLVVALVVALVI